MCYGTFELIFVTCLCIVGTFALFGAVQASFGESLFDLFVSLVVRTFSLLSAPFTTLFSRRRLERLAGSRALARAVRENDDARIRAELAKLRGRRDFPLIVRAVQEARWA